MPPRDTHSVSSILPPPLRHAIPYTHFNRMQSQCLESWDTSSNLLVSAPTGSGKTVCFELAILRHIHNSHHHRGKIVFLAPTKALCAEKAHEWRAKFAPLGLRVELVTGDARVTPSNPRVANAGLVLSTPEKWDALTRNLASNAVDLSTVVSLLLLDEVHHVGEGRGASFELVVTRMLITSDECRRQPQQNVHLPAANLRVIAVSATIRNPHDVAAWLRVPDSCVKLFDHTFRPIPLEFNVLPYHMHNQWQAGKVFDADILNVLHRFAEGKPALVFSPSRRQTGISADCVVEILKRSKLDLVKYGNNLTRNLTEGQRRELLTRARACPDRRLAALLPNGVAVHNADMSASSRQLVEDLFRKSLVPCLFSTSTLAQGVNLPARLVLIAGTAVYQNGEMQEYDKNLLLQMCGRAGRAGLDTKGIAVIMTSKTAARRYQNIDKIKPSRIDSQFQTGFEESLNAEIARQFITDLPSAMTFLTNTFYAIIRVKNARDPTEEKKKLRATAHEKVNTLSSMGLTRFDEDGFGLCSTAAGTSMARYCVSFEAMRSLITNIPGALSPAQVIRIIASCPEILDSVFVRRAEKKKLNELNSLIRLPVRGKVKEPVDKVIVLLQVIMGDHMKSFGTDFALCGEANRLMETASRISTCLLAVVLDQSVGVPYEALFAVLQTCRAVLCRTYWDGPTLLQQIPGIDRSNAKALASAGVQKIEHLSNANATEIENFVQGLSSDLRNNVLRFAKEIPQFHVDTEVQSGIGESTGTTSVEVRLTLIKQQFQSGLLNKLGRGFILVGSHAVGVIALRTFKLDDAAKGLSFRVAFQKPAQNNGWIDVVVGVDSFLGIDVSKRLNLPMKLSTGVTSNKVTIRSEPQKTKASNRKRMITLANAKIAKRFKQELFQTSALVEDFKPLQQPQTPPKNISLATKLSPGISEVQETSALKAEWQADCPTSAAILGSDNPKKNSSDISNSAAHAEATIAEGCRDEDVETETSLDQVTVSKVASATSPEEWEVDPLVEVAETNEYDDILRNIF